MPAHGSTTGLPASAELLGSMEQALMQRQQRREQRQRARAQRRMGLLGTGDDASSAATSNVGPSPPGGSGESPSEPMWGNSGNVDDGGLFEREQRRRGGRAQCADPVSGKRSDRGSLNVGSPSRISGDCSPRKDHNSRSTSHGFWGIVHPGSLPLQARSKWSSPVGSGASTPRHVAQRADASGPQPRLLQRSLSGVLSNRSPHLNQHVSTSTPQLSGEWPRDAAEPSKNHPDSSPDLQARTSPATSKTARGARGGKSTFTSRVGSPSHIAPVPIAEPTFEDPWALYGASWRHGKPSGEGQWSSHAWLALVRKQIREKEAEKRTARTAAATEALHALGAAARRLLRSTSIEERNVHVVQMLENKERAQKGEQATEQAAKKEDKDAEDGEPRPSFSDWTPKLDMPGSSEDAAAPEAEVLGNSRVDGSKQGKRSSFSDWVSSATTGQPRQALPFPETC